MSSTNLNYTNTYDLHFNFPGSDSETRTTVPMDCNKLIKNRPPLCKTLECPDDQSIAQKLDENADLIDKIKFLTDNSLYIWSPDKRTITKAPIKTDYINQNGKNRYIAQENHHKTINEIESLLQNNQLFIYNKSTKNIEIASNFPNKHSFILKTLEYVDFKDTVIRHLSWDMNNSFCDKLISTLASLEHYDRSGNKISERTNDESCAKKIINLQYDPIEKYTKKLNSYELINTIFNFLAQFEIYAWSPEQCSIIKTSINPADSCIEQNRFKYFQTKENIVELLDSNAFFIFDSKNEMIEIPSRAPQFTKLVKTLGSDKKFKEMRLSILPKNSSFRNWVESNIFCKIEAFSGDVWDNFVERIPRIAPFIPFYEASSKSDSTKICDLSGNEITSRSPQSCLLGQMNSQYGLSSQLKFLDNIVLYSWSPNKCSLTKFEIRPDLCLSQHTINQFAHMRTELRYLLSKNFFIVLDKKNNTLEIPCEIPNSEGLMRTLSEDKELRSKTLSKMDNPWNFSSSFNYLLDVLVKGREELRRMRNPLIFGSTQPLSGSSQQNTTRSISTIASSIFGFKPNI